MAGIPSDNCEWDTISDKVLGKAMEKFEDDLECPICQDLFSNPQSLKCGHSFCSLCIRRHLDSSLNRSTSNICPVCRDKAELFDLRKNSSLNIIVEKYQDLRSMLFSRIQRINVTDSNENSVVLGKVDEADYGRIPGISINSKFPQYNHHIGNRELLKKFIEDTTKKSKIRLRTDGDKETLGKRFREFVHLANAQLDSLNPLSLDAVIKKINDIENASEREQMKFQVCCCHSVKKVIRFFILPSFDSKSSKPRLDENKFIELAKVSNSLFSFHSRLRLLNSLLFRKRLC
jgi:hypothetical protein